MQIYPWGCRSAHAVCKRHTWNAFLCYCIATYSAYTPKRPGSADVRDMAPSRVWHRTLIHVTRHIHISHVWHGTCIRVRWHILTCDPHAHKAASMASLVQGQLLILACGTGVCATHMTWFIPVWHVKYEWGRCMSAAPCVMSSIKTSCHSLTHIVHSNAKCLVHQGHESLTYTRVPTPRKQRINEWFISRMKRAHGR